MYTRFGAPAAPPATASSTPRGIELTGDSFVPAPVLDPFGDTNTPRLSDTTHASSLGAFVGSHTNPSLLPSLAGRASPAPPSPCRTTTSGTVTSAPPASFE